MTQTPSQTTLEYFWNFEDIQEDLHTIPRCLHESFDKPALDFLLSTEGEIKLKQIMEEYGELVHSKGNDEGIDLVKKLHDQKVILEKYSRKGGSEGIKATEYYRKAWSKGGLKMGRRFAPGSCSLQSISRPIRHTIANTLYYDADMKNCHPVALEHFWTSSLSR